MKLEKDYKIIQLLMSAGLVLFVTYLDDVLMILRT